MNMETYEETRLRRDDSWAKYMVEGMDVSLLTWNGKVGQWFGALRACCLWQDRVMEGCSVLKFTCALGTARGGLHLFALPTDAKLPCPLWSCFTWQCGEVSWEGQVGLELAEPACNGNRVVHGAARPEACSTPS